MELNPKISIITPSYNSEKNIEACILSVAKQSYHNKEHLIIDGLSTDNTISIVKKYAEKYPHIRFISENDAGIYDAMNKGIDLASGEWVYFLGSDDLLHTNSVLEEIFRLDGIMSYDVVYGNVLWGDTDIRYDGKFSLMKLMEKNICHQAIFYKKTVFLYLGKYDTKYKIWADWLFNIMCFTCDEIHIKYVDVIVSKFAFGGQSSDKRIDVEFIRDKSMICNKYFPPECVAIEEKLHSFQSEMESKDRQICEVRQLLAEREVRIANLLSSWSWRLTAPLRWFGSLAQRVNRLIKQSIMTLTSFVLGLKAGVTGPPEISQGFAGEPLEYPAISTFRPLVSVIMPVFNACRSDKRYFLSALESIAKQSYSNIELIVVDDGSTDDTLQVLNEFMIRYPLLKMCYFYKENGGQSSARNYGVKKCSGEYVGFIDQDDEWYADKLEIVVPWLEYKNIDVLYTDSDVIDGNDVITHKNIHKTYHMGWPHPKRTIEDILFKDIFVMPGLMTIKKEFFERIGGFDENLSGYEDDDLFLRLYENGHIFYLPHATLRWRIYGDNYSFSHRMLSSRTYYWKKLLRDYTDNGTNRVRVSNISQRFFLEFVTQAILQNINGNDLYKSSLSGAHAIIPNLPARQKYIFTAIFLLPPNWLVFFLRCLTGR